MAYQLAVALRLHFRNRLALLYSYIFPTLFLLVFWVLYRYESVPLVRHLGELLTVTALGGACFGLPTTLVSERERGVWRRYRLAPVPARELLASTLLARYVLLLLAGLLQLALALALGMPLPRHPVDLWVAFTTVCFALLGLGLVIAMLANSVPAVQALGQCLFLPLLVIGGVAVPLERLPEWAQRAASFFPGRYAVDAIQATVTGPGLGGARFSVLALLLIGAAACAAGGGLFRWDVHQTLRPARSVGWVALALAAWVGVGVWSGATIDSPRPTASARTTNSPPPRPDGPSAVPDVPSSPRPDAPSPLPDSQEIPAVPSPEPPSAPPGRPTPSRPPGRDRPPPDDRPAAVAPPPKGGSDGSGAPKSRAAAEMPNTRTADEPPSNDKPAQGRSTRPETWKEVTIEDVDRDLRFDRLPPDNGVVSPIADPAEEPDTDLANHLEFLTVALVTWPPAQVADPVQRVRNILYVAAVPDVFQIDPLERFVPHVVFDHLQQNIPKDELIKILYWIALHPTQGDDSAVDQLRALKLGNGPSDIEQTRERAALYAVKLLGTITGKR